MSWRKLQNTWSSTCHQGHFIVDHVHELQYNIAEICERMMKGLLATKLNARILFLNLCWVFNAFKCPTIQDYQPIRSMVKKTSCGICFMVNQAEVRFILGACQLSFSNTSATIVISMMNWSIFIRNSIKNVIGKFLCYILTMHFIFETCIVFQDGFRLASIKW